MPHYLTTTRGGATCFFFKVAVSLPIWPIPKPWTAGQLCFFSSFSQLFILPLTDAGQLCQNCWLESRLSVSFSHSWMEGKMEGLIEKGNERKDYWTTSAKRPYFGVLASKVVIRLWHRMTTQWLASGLAVHANHLQITKIKSSHDAVKLTFKEILRDYNFINTRDLFIHNRWYVDSTKTSAFRLYSCSCLSNQVK